MFVSRGFKWLAKGGSLAVVSPQNWLFLTTYKKLRERLLRDETWDVVARLGSGAFETIGGAVVNVALLALSRGQPEDTHAMLGLDASTGKTPTDKAVLLRGVIGVEAGGDLGGETGADLRQLPQAGQRKNPDARLLIGDQNKLELLSTVADAFKGLSTGDINRFIGVFWERPNQSGKWEWYQGGVDTTAAYGGRSQVLYWENGTGAMVNSPQCYVKGTKAWRRAGVSVNQMNRQVALYTGEMFDENAAAVVVECINNLPAVWTYMSSSDFNEDVTALDAALKVTNKSMVKVPFDLAHWQQVAAQKYPEGLPEPESDDPTQWLFHGRPEASENPLQVAVARLAGYRWPSELEGSMRLSARARLLATQCEALLKFADDDGIVCIPSVRGEEPAEQRPMALLTTCGIKPERNLDDWLRDGFFEEHCKLFHHRPFIWHIWDGRKRDGFHVLVNYHKLADGKQGKKLPESLTYSYLGDWISRQQDGVKSGTEGAEDRLAAAMELQKRLKLILDGEPPFDLFVRWKKLGEQAIGWEADINDGVRMNIRPFLASDIPGGKKGAGILRAKPNIKWEKDRGNEPQRAKADYPWFWGWDETSEDFMGGKEFKGERFNDYHYTIAAKQKAREARAKGAAS